MLTNVTHTPVNNLYSVIRGVIPSSGECSFHTGDLRKTPTTTPTDSVKIVHLDFSMIDGFSAMMYVGKLNGGSVVYEPYLLLSGGSGSYSFNSIMMGDKLDYPYFKITAYTTPGSHPDYIGSFVIQLIRNSNLNAENREA